ncbi:MAG: prepilin-type N-terminal cleavage/methylation domain-containing protein [bacterium]|nr:prepilin-type N-terminal cleavage/methylation domain-containing protein [bacterium]
MKKWFVRQNGFTLIELVLVVALLGIILIITTVNLVRPVSKTKADSVATDIVSIIQEAQTKAINTDTAGTPQAVDWGVHFENNKYILFKGSSFNSSDATNFVVDTPPNISLNSDLPCPSPPGNCNNIVFAKISGEVVGFDETKNSVCVTETATNKSVLLIINFIGVVNVQSGC